jgi:hypothetical protein
MGAVYAAEHLGHGRRVALKVLSQRFARPEDRARFLREGQLAAGPGVEPISMRRTDAFTRPDESRRIELTNRGPGRAQARLQDASLTANSGSAGVGHRRGAN